MVKSFMARRLHKDELGPHLGLFKLRLSELKALAHLEPRSFCTVTSESSSQSGWKWLLTTLTYG